MANQNKTNTSTQVRNFYSDGHAYMNVSFFNLNLSIKMQPFLSKNNIGISKYDASKAQTTTIGYESAYLLSNLIGRIIDKKESLEGIIPIPCGNDAKLEFERLVGSSGIMETWLHLTKNNIKISYLFGTQIINVKVDGQMTQQVIETDLGVFQKTIDGYLGGINSDRHLDKLTDDYVKAQQAANGGQNNRGGNNYQGNNYKKPYYNNNGGNGGYKKPYYNNNNGGNNGNYNRQNNNNWNPPKQQDMSTYQISN